MTLRHRIGGYCEYAPDAGAPRFCEAFWTRVPRARSSRRAARPETFGGWGFAARIEGLERPDRDQ
jgi:hypothetical protein